MAELTISAADIASALKNNLDMWARWLSWFDRYVKGEGTRGVTSDGS